MLIALNPDRRISSLFPVLIILGLNGVRAIANILYLDTRDFLILFSILLAELLLKKDVPIVPFDLQAAAFLSWLAYIFARYQWYKRAPERSYEIRQA
jgi:hypothetical protein